MQLIKREILPTLDAHLTQKEITLIVGARQVGKTTLMNILQEKLRLEGKRTLFLSLDFDEDKPHFNTQRALTSKIGLEFGNNDGFVFIDEIQRKTDAGLFLKGIYDMGLPYKFIVSGSGSLELKEKIHESLAGRKQLFKVSSLSFSEFLNYKTEYRYTDRLPLLLSTEPMLVDSLLREYLNFGGYPRVVLESTRESKMRIIDELFRSYLERDISYLLGVQHHEEYRSLVRILSGQIGQLLNIAELSRLVRVSEQTIKKYLLYLEKTFILERVTPFTKNITSEIVKSPVCYFHDIGLRNYARGEFGRLDHAQDMGFVFQNFAYLLLRQYQQHGIEPLHFWRTKNGAEVDFVLTRGETQIPIEVKYSECIEPHVERSMRNFITKYTPNMAYIVNKNRWEEKRVDATNVVFIPWWKIITDAL